MLEDVSDWKDCDLEVIGMVRLLRPVSDFAVSTRSMTGVDLETSSMGMASAAGIGCPLAAATN